MKCKIIMIVLMCCLIFSLCVPASANVIDDVFSFFNGNEKVSVDLKTVDPIVKNIIESSSGVSDAVNKIVTTRDLNSMEKLKAQTVVFGYNESLMSSILNIDPTKTETPEESALAEEARQAYDDYLAVFTANYKPTGKFGDPIN